MTVDQNISSRIDLMRIVLIFGIVLVHVPYDADASPFVEPNGTFDWIRVYLGESLFRIGVPCLSAISGYLLFQRGYERFDYRKTLMSKSRSVLLPFLLWNLSLLALVLVIEQVGMGIGYFPDLVNAGAGDWPDHAFGLSDYPVNLPLYFLRDLIVCILLSPILAFLVRRAPAMTLGVLFALAVFPTLDVGLVLKKSILFSFTFGIFLALYRVDLKKLDRYAWPMTAALVATSALLAHGLYMTGPDFPPLLNVLRNVLSILGATAFWMLSSLLIRTRLGQRLSRTGSLSFWTFCGHYPLLVVFWMIWNRYAGAELYPIFYIGAVLLTYSLLILSNGLVLRWMPRVYAVLTGNRRRTNAAGAVSQGATLVGNQPSPAMQEQR